MCAARARTLLCPVLLGEGEHRVHCRWVLCAGLSTARVVSQAGWRWAVPGTSGRDQPSSSPGSPSSEAARQHCLQRKCRERLGPVARGSAHSRGWKSWRRRRGKSAGAPGAWRPPALFWTSSRSPPPQLPLPTSSEAGTQHSKSSSQTWGVAPRSLSLQSRG